MNSRGLISACNYLGYVVILLGVIISIYTFDFSLYLNLHDAKELARFSTQSDYLQGFVKSQQKLVIDNIIKVVLIIIVSILIGFNLWYKAKILEQKIETEVVENGEQASENEEVETTNENL